MHPNIHRVWGFFASYHIQYIQNSTTSPLNLQFPYQLSMQMLPSVLSKVQKLCS